jgi:L-lactate dehydrogenase complex protein LldF
VYQQVGGHAYGSVYPGPIGSVITPQLMGIEKAAQLPFASSLCGACREVCPVKIDIPQLLLHLRAEISGQQASGRRRERLAFKLWALVMTRPWLYRTAAIFARRFQRWFESPLAALTNGRDLRPLERESFREHWRRTH